MRQLNVRIQNEVYELLKKESAAKRLSMARLVEHFVHEGIKQQPKNLIRKVIGL